MNGALLLGPDSSSNLQIQKQQKMHSVFSEDINSNQKDSHGQYLYSQDDSTNDQLSNASAMNKAERLKKIIAYLMDQKCPLGEMPPTIKAYIGCLLASQD